MSVYGFLRRAQKRILEGNLRLTRFSSRDTFTVFADQLVKKFFSQTLKKTTASREYVHRAYVDWLILAPLVSRKWLPHPGMHRGHYSTLARRACNKQTRQWFFVRKLLDIPAREELAQRATINACELADVRDVYWLEEEFSFLAWLAHSGGLKSRLARWVILPWAFLDVDHEYDQVLHHSIPGREKEIARAGKQGSATYFRLGSEIWIFASREIARKVDLPWVDLREQRAEALDWVFFYQEGISKQQGKKRLTGGLNIEIQESTLKRVKDEAKAIAHQDISPHYKLYKLNEVAATFMHRHRYAVSAGRQFQEIGRVLRDLVQSKVAATLGPDAVKKGIYPGFNDLDRQLYFSRLNPFYDPHTPDESTYLDWWSPYQP